DQRVFFPVANRLPIVRWHDDVRVRVLTAIQINDAQAVGEPEHHVDDGWHLHHADGPHARHDHRHAGGIALANAVAIALAFLLRFGRIHHRLLAGFIEFRIRRAEAKVRERTTKVYEPRARQIEGRLGAFLREI